MIWLWRTFWAIAYKEVLRVQRTRRFVATIIALELATIFSLAWIDLTIRDLPLVVVDQDHSAASRELIARVSATGTFRVNYLTSSPEQARSHIRAGHAKVALVVPPDYGRLRSTGVPAQILVLVDGSNAAESEQATQAIDQLALEMSVQASEETVSRVEARGFLLFNPNARTALFMLPGLLALILSERYLHQPLFFVEERESGNLERLMMTPMSHAGVILGLMAPYVVLAFLNALGYLVLMRLGFGVPIRGSTPWLVFGIACYSVCIMSIGALIAASARTYDVALTQMVLLGLPSTMLSGYLFPLSSVPKALLPISYAIPETHLIAIMRGLCLRGATASDLAPHFLYLGLAPILFTTLAIVRFTKSLRP